MKLLAVDTSTRACSVALWSDDHGAEIFEVAPNRHSSLILGMVDQVQAEFGTVLGQCEAIAFGKGPGSFTGLRIGVGVVQGLAFGADIPVLPVSSLYAQAARAGARNVLAAFDARMGQVYWGLYRLESNGSPSVERECTLTAPGLIRLPCNEKWVAAGSGCDLYRETILERNQHSDIDFVLGSLPHAVDIARLGAADYRAGKFIPAAQAKPEYVRNQVTN